MHHEEEEEEEEEGEEAFFKANLRPRVSCFGSSDVRLLFGFQLKRRIYKMHLIYCCKDL